MNKSSRFPQTIDIKSCKTDGEPKNNISKASVDSSAENQKGRLQFLLKFVAIFK